MEIHVGYSFFDFWLIFRVLITQHTTYSRTARSERSMSGTVVNNASQPGRNNLTICILL